MILRTQNERALEAEIERLKTKLQRYKEKDLLEMQKLEELLTRLHEVEFRNTAAQKNSVRFTLAVIFIAFLGSISLAVLIC